jgi:zinc and cadmium transporter
MSVTLLAVAYGIVIVLASLVGGWIPSRTRFSHAGMQGLMSFVAGLMLGVGVLHMIPHAGMETGSWDQTVRWLLAGLLVTFLLQRFFHFHQHELPPALDEDQAEGHEHGPTCTHHHHDHGQTHVVGSNQVGWIGLGVGLTLHTLLDGMALAASIQSDAEHVAAGGLLGVGTFLAVALHKPLDAMSLAVLMMAAGVSPRSRSIVNFVFALIAPLGMLVAFLSLDVFAQRETVLGSTLAFSAGVFLCISLCDLLPELQFHSHDRIRLTVCLFAGIGLAYLIGLTESSGHDHHQHGGHEHSHSSARPDVGPAANWPAMALHTPSE